MGCADGWRIYDDMCFLIQPQILSYNDARATCVADQADLAIITSLDMNVRSRSLNLPTLVQLSYLALLLVSPFLSISLVGGASQKQCNHKLL